MKTKFKATSFRSKFKVVDNHGVMWTKNKSKKDAEKIAHELNETEYERDVISRKMFEKDFDKLSLNEAQQVNSKLKSEGYKLPIDYIMENEFKKDTSKTRITGFKTFSELKEHANKHGLKDGEYSFGHNKRLNHFYEFKR